MDVAILLVDKDLGLLFWLGRILDHAGYPAFPARNVPDAAALLAELHLTISALILDCSLPGTEGLIAGLRGSNKYLKAICLGEHGHHACVRGVDAFCPKPVGFSERSKSEWLKAIREALSAKPSATLIHPTPLPV
jgi:DNA-binding response OmpR family regulator